MKVLDSVTKDKSKLIKALQLTQAEAGYISDQAIEKIADHFSVSVVEVEGVITFYTQFKREKPAKYTISVCDGTACHIKGSSLVLNWLDEALEEKDEGIFSVEAVACLGCCSLAPVMSINGKVYGKLNRKSLLKIIAEYRERGDK